MDFGGLAGDIGQAVQGFVPSFAPAPQAAPAPASIEVPAPAPAPEPQPAPVSAPQPRPQSQPAPHPAPAPPPQTHPAPAPTAHTQAPEEVTKTEFRTLSSGSTTTQSSTSTTTTTTTSPTREPYGYLSTSTPSLTPESTLPPIPNGLTHEGAVGLGVGIAILVALLLSALAVKFFYFDRRKVFNGSGSNWIATNFRRKQSVQEINPWPRPGGYAKQPSFESIPAPTRPAEVRQFSALTTAVPSTAGTIEKNGKMAQSRAHVVDFYKPGR